MKIKTIPKLVCPIEVKNSVVTGIKALFLGALIAVIAYGVLWCVADTFEIDLLNLV